MLRVPTYNFKLYFFDIEYVFQNVLLGVAVKNARTEVLRRKSNEWIIINLLIVGSGEFSTTRCVYQLIIQIHG